MATRRKKETTHSARRAHNVNTDPARIAEVLSRGVAEVISREHLEKKMRSGVALRVKLGIDPTGRNLHIGHGNTLLKLRDFQELGHQVVLIIGDATGRVGDSSDKESQRPILSKKEVTDNQKTYLAQIGKILDLKKTDVRYNSQWLDTLSFAEIGEQAEQFSLSDFISRELIARRLAAGTRVSLRETLYPLMQGYDSVAVRSDVELGGTDQRFNLLAGRTLQAHYAQEPQDVVILKLLPGTDGRKMSKSLGNTINILDEPKVMYANVMRINDALMPEYFEICTRMSRENVHAALAVPPRDAKMLLAKEIVTVYHGAAAAERAQDEFVRVFSHKELPTHVPEAVARERESIEDVLMREKIVPSKSEVRRLVIAGGLRNAESGEKINDVKRIMTAPVTLKVGKKKFIKIILHLKKK
jgi:tyrosyl-tRNA synthetase